MLNIELDPMMFRKCHGQVHIYTTSFRCARSHLLQSVRHLRRISARIQTLPSLSITLLLTFQTHIGEHGSRIQGIASVTTAICQAYYTTLGNVDIR